MDAGPPQPERIQQAWALRANVFNTLWGLQG